jgi:hypothetical protein
MKRCAGGPGLIFLSVEQPRGIEAPGEARPEAGSAGGQPCE